MHFLIVPWDPNPEIFKLGSFAVRWYGLLFASSFLFGYFIIRKMFRNEGLADEVLDRLTIYMAIGTVVGARLGHCLLYEPTFYLSHPVEILMVWHGGLASHGAALEYLHSRLFVLRRKKDISGLSTGSPLSLPFPGSLSGRGTS